MNKQLKKILIASGFLVFVSAVAVALVIFLPQIKNTADKTKNTSNIYLYNMDSSLITRIEVKHPLEGKAYVITAKVKNGNAVYAVQGDNTFAYKQSIIGITVGMISQFQATKMVTDDLKNPSEYGLTTKSPTLEFTTTDGVNHLITFGNKTPFTDKTYYVRIDNEPKVYIVNESFYSTFLMPVTSYRDLTILLTVGTDYVDLSSYKVTNPDGKVIDIELNPNKDVDMSVYRETSPYTGLVDNYNIATMVFDKLYTLEATGVVEDYPKHLADFGLDKPYRVEVVSKLGEKMVLLIGRAEKDFTYIKREDVPSVWAATGDFTFLDVNGADVLDTSIWMYNIHDVSKCVYKTPEATYTFNIDDRTNKEGKGDFFASFNNKSITQDNARSLYSAMLTFYAVGAYENKLPDKYQYEMTFTMRDGTVNVMKLYRLNSRQYAAEVNGKCRSYVSVTAINELQKTIDTILSGGALSTT